MEEFKKTATAETKYEGGAQRDSRTGKGAPQWMPTVALFLVSRIYEMGNIQRDKLSGGAGNGDTRNWENGMKIADFVGSGIRHAERYLEGDRSEPHLPQAIWNLLNALMMSVWIYLGFRSASFNNLPDHIHPWKPGDPPPSPLSSQEIDWLKLRGIEKQDGLQLTDQYLAATVDGEGTISIIRRESKRREAYSLRVSVWNTNKLFLERIKKQFGGSLVPGHKATEKHAASYVLVWSHASAAVIVNRIAPLLIVKAKQADVALTFQSIVSKLQPGKNGTSEDILMELRRLKQEINDLNLKGPSKKP